MAQVKVALPGPRVPIADGNGHVTDPWRQAFEALFKRTGGSETDKVEVAAQSGETATTAAAAADAAASAANAAAVAAQTAADNAQTAADSVTTTTTALAALQSLQASGVDENMTITTHDAGSSVTLLFNAHTRYYGDGTSVSVNSGSVGSLSYGAVYYIWYDDASRAGGAVTYHADATNADAFPSDMHPNRHYVGASTAINAADPDADGSPNYWAPQ